MGSSFSGLQGFRGQDGQQGQGSFGGYSYDQGVPTYSGPPGANPSNYGTLGGYPTIRPYPFGAFSGGGAGGGFPGGAGGPLPGRGGGFETPLSFDRPAPPPAVASIAPRVAPQAASRSSANNGYNYARSTPEGLFLPPGNPRYQGPGFAHNATPVAAMGQTVPDGSPNPMFPGNRR